MPYKPELKMREYDLFRGYYCGLCKTLGKEFNQLVRLGLNYDLTFLALLLSSLDPNKDTIMAEACIANPIKKKPVIQRNDHLGYTAHISSILIYFKLIDDWKDERSIPALFSRLAFMRPVRKSKRIYPEKYRSIKGKLDRLNQLEKEKCPVIDESADVFAKLMEEIADSPSIVDENTSRILRWLGYNMGRWIYILDAFHDIEKDIKDKSYNPILLQYHYNDNKDISSFIEEVSGPIEFSLTYTLDHIAKSFELLDIKYNRGILENMIYIGTRHKMEQILKKGVVQCEKSI